MIKDQNEKQLADLYRELMKLNNQTIKNINSILDNFDNKSVIVKLKNENIEIAKERKIIEDKILKCCQKSISLLNYSNSSIF